MKMNQREFMNKYRFEVIGGTLVYCMINQMIHGYTIGWQGVAAAAVFVILVSFYKGTIKIKWLALYCIRFQADREDGAVEMSSLWGYNNY